MRRFWAALAVLLLLLAGSLANAWYVGQLAGRLSGQLLQARELAGQDQWEQAGRLARQAYAQWQGHHFYLHAVLRHGDTDGVQVAFRAALDCLEREQAGQYAAASGELLERLALLAQAERPSAANVL